MRQSSFKSHGDRVDRKLKLAATLEYREKKLKADPYKYLVDEEIHYTKRTKNLGEARYKGKQNDNFNR